MGTIDPLPSTRQATRPTVRRPVQIAAPPHPLRRTPKEPGLTAAGWLGIGFGLVLFTMGALAGLNLLLMGMGGAFMAAGSFAREKVPAKVCPACRLAIPLEASVCGHCRTAL